MALSSHIFALLLLAVAWWTKSGEALGSFGFDIHHRYSNSVKSILGVDGLPEKDTIEYYKAMLHRDHLLRGRHLASEPDPLLVNNPGGNITFQLSDLGFLHYAFVNFGTPSTPFLVALDTGSDLTWLPCECTTCARNFTFSSGTKSTIKFNSYSPNASTTSSIVSCKSSMCGASNKCLPGLNTCAYQTNYLLTTNTSSTGILVQDLLHLATYDADIPPIDTQITLGCGIIQTGAFLRNRATNGLFGLGMRNISVPSVLANKGLTANSFSMCFDTTGIGRLEFGDIGSYAQGETKFNIQPSRPSYNISIIQVTAGAKSANLTLTAVFDSGTSFTTLQDPSYTIIAKTFNSHVQDLRHQNDSTIPFEYCYSFNSTSKRPAPAFSLSLTMKGGDQYNVSVPYVIFVNIKGADYVYCLAIVKSASVNIIGQNFMTGKRIIFNREKMVLGWKEANCYGTEKTESGLGTPPPAPPPPIRRRNTTEAPPEGTLENTVPFNDNGSPSNLLIGQLLILLFSLFSHYFIHLSA